MTNDPQLKKTTHKKYEKKCRQKQIESKKTFKMTKQKVGEKIEQIYLLFNCTGATKKTLAEKCITKSYACVSDSLNVWKLIYFYLKSVF